MLLLLLLLLLLLVFVSVVVWVWCCCCCLFFLICLNLGSHGCCFVVVAWFSFGCCFFCLFVVLLFCCFVFVVWATTTKERTTPPPPPKKQQNQLFYSVFARWVWCCCRFLVCLWFFCSLEFGVPWLLFCCGCLLLFWLLLLLFFVVLLFVFVVWATTTKKTQQKKQQNPLFYSVFSQLSLQIFGHRKANSPRPSKKHSFLLLFVRKGFFSAERSVWFLCCWHFFGVSCFFCLISRSHFERRFRDHKTARPLFKLVFDGLKFWPKLCPNFNILDGNLYRNTNKNRGFKPHEGSKKKTPKWPIWKPASGPTGEPVQGPQMCLILGDFWRSRIVDPEPLLKGLRSAERSFLKFWGPNWLVRRGLKWARIRLSSIYARHIYIYTDINRRVERDGERQRKSEKSRGRHDQTTVHHACMYVCIYLSICPFSYVRIHAYIHVYTCLHICIGAKNWRTHGMSCAEHWAIQSWSLAAHIFFMPLFL